MAAIRLEDFMVASYDITDREPARKLCMRRKTDERVKIHVYVETKSGFERGSSDVENRK
ncbi:6793_t:CDS:2 [Paraglomus brasilianum]|uniref:6793_t:CDS:1 n=1 Tax=Paraglomus brasilianum TaxID=144538 RepID=A0A9N8VD19_9GLOM|nr:6793_t:CDS:2 [Paraglomus brasilianum]